MFKYVLIALCGAALVGLGCEATRWSADRGSSACCGTTEPAQVAVIAVDDESTADVSIGCPGCGNRDADEADTVTADVTTTAPATQPGGAKAALVDVKNTKCIVTEEDVEDDLTLTYQGKIYHICCESCVKKFNKDPEKYLKPFEADPSKYGVKK